MSEQVCSKCGHNGGVSATGQCLSPTCGLGCIKDDHPCDCECEFPAAPASIDINSPNAKHCAACTKRLGVATFHLPPICKPALGTVEIAEAAQGRSIVEEWYRHVAWKVDLPHRERLATMIDAALDRVWDKAIHVVGERKCDIRFEGNWRNGYDHALNDVTRALGLARGNSVEEDKKSG